MLWQNEELEQRPALETSGPMPTTSHDLFTAAWGRNQLTHMNLTGEQDRLNALDDYLEKIKKLGGPDLAPELDYGTFGGGMMPDSHALFAQANAKLAEYKNKNPEFDMQPMSAQEFDGNAINKRRNADADYEAELERPRGAGATLGLVAGGLAAGAVDPINLLALPVAPEASLGILASALRWGAIGAGAATVSEAIQAPYQEQVHPGRLMSGAPLLDIAQAGLFAAGGGVLFPALAKAWEGVRGLPWGTAVKDAGNIVDSQANVMHSNIYPGAEGTTAHTQALPKAIDDALRGHPVDVSQYITPEIEASAGQPAIEATRAETLQARRRALEARFAQERQEPQPELPFVQTAAEEDLGAQVEKLVDHVQDLSRRAGYDMPRDEASTITTRLMNADEAEGAKLYRDLQISPRQVAEAPPHIEVPAEEIPTQVAPVADIHEPNFQDALRADLDREVVSSPGGMPSLAASKSETGLPAPGISSSGVTLPEPSTQPFRGSQTSREPAPLGSLITRATTPPETLVGPTRILGSIDKASNRHILQGSDDLNALVEAARRNKPLVDARLAELAAEVPGAEFYGSRVKDVPGLQGKLATGRPANTISDYLGARIILDTPEALQAVAQKIDDTGSIIELEDFLDPGKEGYRAVHMQLALGDGTSIELQLVPRPVSEVMDISHDLRQPVKRFDIKDPLQFALYKQEMAKAREVMDRAWGKAEAWQDLRPNLAAIDARPVPDTLPEVHSRYFNVDDVTSTIPLEHLVSSKSEADNARSSLNAAKRMDATARGELGGRRPITVAPLPDGRFLIKDGNATFTAAKQYGWKALPVHIRPDPALQPISHSVPNGVAMFSPGELGVDAERFQFKSGGDEAGVTDRLAGVKDWDPIKAGMVLTWTDKDGKAWIVDGHQRVALAKRIAAEDPKQNPQILARTLKETDGITAEKARAIAAMKNIAEGTGTAVDAAKVIRDQPQLAGDLPQRSELVRQARGLVNLSDDAFGMVVNEVVPPNYAAIVGRLMPGDPQKQTALINLLAKTDPANAVQAESIVRQGIEAGFAKANASAQTSLFGEQDVAESLYGERAKVLDRAMKTLRKDEAVFSTLVGERETLETAGNVLAHDINQQRMTADGQALQILQTLANRSGPISDALHAAAARAKSDGYPAAVREFVETVRDLSASGDLTRLANGIERGASHVGDQGAANIIDHGIAAEPVSLERAERAEQQITRLLEEGKLPPPYMQEFRETRPGRPDVTGTVRIPSDEEQRMRSELYGAMYEPGKPQAIMPGMEPSARQAAAARAGPLRAGVAQEAPGGLFTPREPSEPMMFPVGVDAGGRVAYQHVEDALHELDQYKIAAEQIANCASGAPANG